jgi:hypothetical protein
MSLENLVKTGQLKPHPVDAAEISQLFAAAERNLKDASLVEASTETRFDCAYKAAMQAALVALMANGYRPSTNAPGHQMTTIQSLTLTIGLDAKRMLVLDALRKKRNLNDYLGADLDDGSLQACFTEATRLLEDVRSWLPAAGL